MPAIVFKFFHFSFPFPATHFFRLWLTIIIYASAIFACGKAPRIYPDDIQAVTALKMPRWKVEHLDIPENVFSHHLHAARPPCLPDAIFRAMRRPAMWFVGIGHNPLLPASVISHIDT